MFDQIATITLPQPQPRAPKPPRQSLWLRVVACCVKNLTTCHGVRRDFREQEEPAHWLCLNRGPWPTWQLDHTNALRTWKWNARRIAKSHTDRTGDIYIYSIHQLPRSKN